MENEIVIGRWELARAWDEFIVAARAILGYRVFRVSADRVPELQGMLAKHAKKAMKLGLPVPTLEVLGEPFEVRVYHPRRFMMLATLVKMTAPVIKVAGAEFVAACHHTEGGTLVMAAPAFHGTDLSEYRTLDGKRCDHCKAKRKRSHSYVINKDDGRVVVGSTCLRDYLGIDVAAEAAWHGYGAIWNALNAAGKDFSDEMGGGGGGRSYTFTDDYLACAIAAIREQGYRKSMDNNPTRVLVGSMINPSIRKLQDDPEFAALVRVGRSAPYRAAAAYLRGWAMTSLGNSDFDHNLRVAATCSYVAPKSDGLLCYLYPAYCRARSLDMQKRDEKPAVPSKHVGTIGARLELVGRLVKTHVMDSHYGMRTLVTFVTDEGEVITWWKSGALDVQEGTRGKLKATIKKHDIYKGVPQTVVTRGAWSEAS